MIDVRNCDALELLKNLEDNSIDLIVTDPPYKVLSHGNSGLGGMFKARTTDELKETSYKLFKHNDIEVSDYASEFYRVLKDSTHCYVFTNDYNLNNMLNEFINVGFKFTKLIVWDKRNKICNPYYMNQCEYILFMWKTHCKKINNCGDSNLISISNVANKKNGHPTEKPVQLMEKLILNSSVEGDLILDPFVGVGASAIACQNNNRNFIGSEIDIEYYNKTMERLKSIEVNNYLV